MACPAGLKTGGTELAHQLVFCLNQIGVHAIMAYYGEKHSVGVTKGFERYIDTSITLSEVEDSEENILVIPESHPEFLKSFKKIKKYIWWMSVDNYLRYHNILFSIINYGFKNFLKSVKHGKFHFINYPLNNSIFHLYQSEYAKQFLKSKKINSIHRLSDYLNTDYLNINCNTERKNSVLYNPAKGFKFTQKLMKAAPDIRWVPLQNMTTEQVKETLLHSKVYIDFGNHPGKDRFPREAAMCGCCVITGKRGSAKFFEDVPIDEEFKYEESTKTIPRIISKIRECLDNYKTESTKFNGYREFIKNEYQTFQDDVKSIFLSTENTTK